MSDNTSKPSPTPQQVYIHQYFSLNTCLSFFCVLSPSNSRGIPRQTRRLRTPAPLAPIRTPTTPLLPPTHTADITRTSQRPIITEGTVLALGQEIPNFFPTPRPGVSRTVHTWDASQDSAVVSTKASPRTAHHPTAIFPRTNYNDRWAGLKIITCIPMRPPTGEAAGAAFNSAPEATEGLAVAVVVRIM